MDPRTWRTHRLVILASAACLAAGCASSAHHISYQSEHVATLPSPVGPSGVGPVLEHGHLAVGGAYSTTFGEAPGLQRAEGAPGHVYATHAFEGSLRGGVGDRWELGAIVQNQPSIAGHRSGETSCVFVHDCLEDARVTALRTKVLGTPFVSVATEVDIVRFAAAAFLNVGDDEMSAEAARAGARVQAQIVF